MLAAVLNIPIVVCRASVHTQAAHVTVIRVVAVAAVRVSSPLGVDLGGSLLATTSQVNTSLPLPLMLCSMNYWQIKTYKAFRICFSQLTSGWEGND
ncbi:hypothetical protein E2C01_024895 [Portunus trituberculatus]|uniref:Uncharacterized protein n=1 Tax=Portunus trituberculatus TaxID=210409 RepID=A0A5B7EBX8_PORTR|nr:hypothetical protein [Portunus trituberculatus]